MNDKTKLYIGFAVTTGVVIHTFVNSLKIHRQAEAERQQIKDDLDLDLEAIRRARAQVLEELQIGMHDQYGPSELADILNRRIQFERITIRLED